MQATGGKFIGREFPVVLYQKIYGGLPVLPKIIWTLGCLGVLQKGEGDFFDSGVGLGPAVNRRGGNSFGNGATVVFPPFNLKPGVGLFCLWTAPAAKIVFLAVDIDNGILVFPRLVS